MVATLAMSLAALLAQSGVLPGDPSMSPGPLPVAQRPAAVGDRCVCPSQRPGERLVRAMKAVADETADLEDTRRLLVRALRTSHQCFPPDITEQQIADVLRRWRDMPESVLRMAGEIDPFFNVDPQTYVGDGQIGPSRQALPATISYSFVPDVIRWGSGSDVSNVGESDITRKTIAAFNADAIDLTRELTRLGLAAFGKYSGLTQFEVTDDGAPWSDAPGPQPFTGTTRIGGAVTIEPLFAAYNGFPASGGDMFISTNAFSTFWLNGNNFFRNWRNTIIHEHGHGVGLFHQIPCDATKIMEPFINTAFDGLAIDDIRGVQANFGDRFSGNHSWQTAKAFGDITAGAGRSIRQPLLSTNGTLSPSNRAGADWFRIDSSVSGRLLTVRVRPRGGVYNSGEQVVVNNNLCAGSFSANNAQQAGNLRLEYYFDPNAAPSFSSSAGGPGQDEQVQLILGSGARYIAVVDEGPNPDPNQPVQLYDLEIIVDSVPSDPIAVLGVDKIAHVGEPCYFNAAVLSQTTEPGALIAAITYDVNGDGVADLSDAGGVVLHRYLTPGPRLVTATVTDTNGKSATDSIVVDVRNNDTIDGARQIFVNEPRTFSTANLRPTSFAPDPCASPLLNAGVWSLFVPRATGPHTITACEPPFFSSLAVYSGPYNAPTAITCSQLLAPGCPGGTQSRVIQNVLLTAGRPYYIKLSTLADQPSGTFTLDIEEDVPVGACCSIASCSITTAAACTTPGAVWTQGASCVGISCAPPNDACASAAPIAGVGSFPFETRLATTDGPAVPSDCTASTSFTKDVWFLWTAECAGQYVFSVCGGTSFDSVLAVYANGDCASIGAPLECDNDRCGTENGLSRLTLTGVTQGQVVRVRIGTRHDASGNRGNLTVSRFPGPCYDFCSDALPLALNQPFNGNTTSIANNDGDSAFNCVFRNGRGVWFTFTPARSTRYQISTCGTGFFNVVNVLGGSHCGLLSPITCAYADGPGACSGPFVPARVRSVPLTAGTTYRILLTGGIDSVGPPATYFSGPYNIVVRCFADFDQNGTLSPQDIFSLLSAYFAANLDADTNGSNTLSPDDIFTFLTTYFTGC